MSVKNKSVIISKQVITFLDKYSNEFLPCETGGILLGGQDAHNIYITHATSAGRKAIHKNILFKRDGDYSQMQLEKIHKETNGICDYIGEWHSHPGNLKASLLDLMSLFSIANNPFNNIKDPVLLINVHSDSYNWKKVAYQCKGFFIRELPVL